MVEKTPFQKFIELISFDQHVASLDQQLANLKKDVISLENQEADSLKKVELLRRTMLDAKKSVDSKELEMKSLDNADREKKDRLKLTTGQKEYKSLKIEIERVHQKQHDLEQELLVVWKQLEAAEKAHEEKTKNFAQDTEELHASVVAKKAQIDETIALIEEQMKLRPAMIQSIPAEWLEKYIMMRTQISDPVVAIQDGSCSACFYKATEGDMQQLRRNKLIQCKDCYRFLYLKATDELDEKKQ